MTCLFVLGYFLLCKNESKEVAMSDEQRRQYEQELVEDAKRIMEEINSDPDLRDVTVPSGMHDRISEAIREHEEEKELIRLGRRYKRKCKYRKYIVLVATLVLAFAFGITSMGGADRLFTRVSWILAGREQTNVDSDDGGVMTAETSDEEEVYEKIEDMFGFYPIKLHYLPEGVVFKEASIGDKTQEMVMVYGQDEDANIVYYIKPNYRSGSYGIDVEDELLDRYSIEVQNVELHVRKYQVKETQTERWSAQFMYEDVGYFLIVSNIGQEELEKVLESLKFI